MRFLFVRFGLLVSLILAGGLLNTASAASFSLRDVLNSGDAVAACGSNDRLVATFHFVKGQLGSPDRCTVYRYAAHDTTQRSCLSAVAAAAGQSGFLSSLGIDGSGTPAFCAQGCNCADTISYRSVH